MACCWNASCTLCPLIVCDIPWSKVNYFTISFSLPFYCTCSWSDVSVSIFLSCFAFKLFFCGERGVSVFFSYFSGHTFVLIVRHVLKIPPTKGKISLIVQAISVFPYNIRYWQNILLDWKIFNVSFPSWLHYFILCSFIVL